MVIAARREATPMPIIGVRPRENPADGEGAAVWSDADDAGCSAFVDILLTLGETELVHKLDFSH